MMIYLIYWKREEPRKLNWGLIVNARVSQAKMISQFAKHQGEEMKIKLCGVMISFMSGLWLNF